MKKTRKRIEKEYQVQIEWDKHDFGVFDSFPSKKQAKKELHHLLKENLYGRSCARIVKIIRHIEETVEVIHTKKVKK